MSAADYIGAGTTLSSSYYMRSFYVANRNARVSSNRSDMRRSELSYADSTALRRAIRGLGSQEYVEDSDPNIRNNVKAFIEIYNNTLNSASKSGDRNLERNAKQMKALTNEYASQLEKIGVTVKSDGTLDAGSSLFETASLSKFENLFSKDSDYMQRTATYAKRIERRSETLENDAFHKMVSKTNKNTSATPDPGESGDTDEGTEVARIVANALDLNALADPRLGKNVNIVV